MCLNTEKQYCERSCQWIWFETVSSSEGHLIELADCFTRTLGSWCCWPPQERVRGHRRWFVCVSIVLELTKADPIGNQEECIEQCNSNWERIGFEFRTNSPIRLWFQNAIYECMGSRHGPSMNSAGRNYESNQTRLWFAIRIGLIINHDDW